MKVGDKVQVIECNEDNNANKDYKNQTGVIIVYNNPLVHVMFNSGVVEAFWNEEVRIIE